MLEMFGFGRINPNPYATNLIRIPENDHYITELQFAGEYHTFDRMVTATIVEEWRSDVAVLAEAFSAKTNSSTFAIFRRGAHSNPKLPILFATRWGKGKAVQFALNPRVWRKGFFGHARGIDDLFWRSILWTVRKPFAANMIPPFVTLSVDDCSGRTTSDMSTSPANIPSFL